MSVELSRRLLPGCGDACQVEMVVVLRGNMQRETRVYHDPVAHEAYGARRADEGGEQYVVRTGPLVIDLSRQEAANDGHPLEFFRMRGQSMEQIGTSQPSQWRLLEILAVNVGRTVTYRALAWMLFGCPEAGRYEFHHLRVIASRLRARMGDASRLVVTVPGIGLRLEKETPL